MLSGDVMINKTTWYNQQLNFLNFDTIMLNGTIQILPTVPFFIKHDSTNKLLTVAPTSISHFGVHTLRFIVSATAAVFYEVVI